MWNKNQACWCSPNSNNKHMFRMWLFDVFTQHSLNIYLITHQILWSSLQFTASVHLPCSLLDAHVYRDNVTLASLQHGVDLAQLTDFHQITLAVYCVGFWHSDLWMVLNSLLNSLWFQVTRFQMEIFFLLSIGSQSTVNT